MYFGEDKKNKILTDEEKIEYGLPLNQEYYIDENGILKRGRKPTLLALYNQNVNYAMGYCELKQCYLTPSNVSEKQCLLKGKVGFGCKYFCLLQGNQCKYGVKKFKQKKWGGIKNDKQS